MEGLAEKARAVIERGIKEGFVLEVEKRDHVIVEDGVKLHLSVSTNIIKKEKDKRVGDVFETIDPRAKVTELGGFIIVPNYYAILPSHLLAVSKTFTHQISRISLDECKVISELLSDDNIVCYNGGQGSGASQLHRHFHLILSLSSLTIPLGNVIKKNLFRKYFPTSALEFYSKELEDQFMMSRNKSDIDENDTLKDNKVSPIMLLLALRKCEKFVGIRICKTVDGSPLLGWERKVSQDSMIDVTEDVGYDPIEDVTGQYYLDDFSLVACRFFVAMFPRFKEMKCGSNLNSISFTGCVFVKNESEFKTIVDNTILKTLSSATIFKH